MKVIHLPKRKRSGFTLIRRNGTVYVIPPKGIARRIVRKKIAQDSRGHE